MKERYMRSMVRRMVLLWRKGRNTCRRRNVGKMEKGKKSGLREACERVS